MLNNEMEAVFLMELALMVMKMVHPCRGGARVDEGDNFPWKEKVLGSVAT